MLFDSQYLNFDSSAIPLIIIITKRRLDFIFDGPLISYAHGPALAKGLASMELAQERMQPGETVCLRAYLLQGELERWEG